MKLILQIAAGVLLAKLVTLLLTLWVGAAAMKSLTSELPKLDKPKADRSATVPAAQKPSIWATPDQAEIDRLNRETDAADARFATEAEHCTVTTEDGRVLNCPSR